MQRRTRNHPDCLRSPWKNWKARCCAPRKATFQSSLDDPSARKKQRRRLRAPLLLLYDGTVTSYSAIIARRAADRLRQGHLWVYQSDVETLQPAEIPPGELVRVLDRGEN